MGILIPMAAARLARGAVGKGYERIASKPPPRDPSKSDVPWKEAIIWAVATGVTGGLTKLVSRRLLAPTPVPIDRQDQDELSDPDFEPDWDIDLT